MRDDEESALVVAVPEAEAAVGSFRAELDSGAMLGVPAHITILYPFMPAARIDPALLAQLTQLFATIDEFRFSLTSIGWFGRQVVYVRPEPDRPFRELTSLVAQRWPAWPPYEGAHGGEPTPHLTIGDNGDVAELTRAAESVERALPIDVTVSAVDLFTGKPRPRTWKRRTSFALGPGRTD